MNNITNRVYHCLHYLASKRLGNYPTNFTLKKERYWEMVKELSALNLRPNEPNFTGIHHRCFKFMDTYISIKREHDG